MINTVALNGIKVLNGKLVSIDGYAFSEPVLHDIVRAVNLHETYAKTINEIKEQLMHADDRMAMLEAIEKAVNMAIAKTEGK